MQYLPDAGQPYRNYDACVDKSARLSDHATEGTKALPGSRQAICEAVGLAAGLKESRTVGEIVRSFEQLERVIERGLQTFIEVGQALLEIRDRKLYREEYRTFEEYCQERWKWSRQRSNQLISAAVVTANLTTTVVKPESERQVRSLASLPPEDQRAVWDAAVKAANGSQPTAKYIMTEVLKRVKARMDEVTPSPARDPEREREEQALRESVRQNSIHNSHLLNVVRALETLAAPQVPLSEVADYIVKYDEYGGQDWRGQVPKAVDNLATLLEEIERL